MLNMYAMRDSLHRMRLETSPMLTALYQGRPEKDEEREKRLRILENVLSRLAVMIRDVGNAQHLQDARSSGLHNIPRELRYGQQQAIQQRRADLEAFRTEAEAYAEEVRKLLDANGLLSPTQRAMKLADLMEKFIKGAEQTMGTGVPHGPGPEIMPPHVSGELSGAVNVVLFLWLALQKLRAKAKKDEAGEKA
jgi:hypothetical protein